MNLTKVEHEKLNDIIQDLSMVKLIIEYKGYDPERISIEDAIGTVCSKVVELIEIIQGNTEEIDQMTKEDYEAIYGWGGQG